jgi:hypothetical protein
MTARTTTDPSTTTQKGNTMTETTTTPIRAHLARFVPSKRGMAGALAGAAIVGSASFTIAPAINASPAAQSAGISIPAAGAEAATAPDCNRSGIPIKWGKCYGPTILWERGETFSYYGKSYTRYYEKARAFYSGVPGFIERTGDTRAQPTSWAAPRP